MPNRMKTSVKMMGLAAPVLALATVASAQTDQWLQYRTASGGSGYRWLEVSTNAPPGVALPALNANPLFVLWTTPLDAKGRWACLDRTRKSGPHNRLFIDRNGDGKLADEPPLDANRVDSYSASFAPVRLVFKGEDGPTTYHLALRAMRYGAEDLRVLAASGCSYAGKVDLGGRKHSLTLVDRNVNGTFNDLAANPSDCDSVLVEGDKTGERLLGELLEIKDQFFKLDVARDGAVVRAQPARELQFGRVHVPEAITEFVAVGVPGHFVRKPASGEFTLPVGKYRVHGWNIERKDAKGAAWTLSGAGFDEFATLEVAAEQTANLDLGEPVLVALTATENKGGATFSLKLKGRLGETVELLRGKERPSAPQLYLASTGGAYRATNSFEYG
jgi:hypothetical protein